MNATLVGHAVAGELAPMFVEPAAPRGLMPRTCQSCTNCTATPRSVNHVPISAFVMLYADDGESQPLRFARSARIIGRIQLGNTASSTASSHIAYLVR